MEGWRADLGQWELLGLPLALSLLLSLPACPTQPLPRAEPRPLRRARLRAVLAWGASGGFAVELGLMHRLRMRIAGC